MRSPLCQYIVYFWCYADSTRLDECKILLAGHCDSIIELHNLFIIIDISIAGMMCPTKMVIWIALKIKCYRDMS